MSAVLSAFCQIIVSFVAPSNPHQKRKPSKHCVITQLVTHCFRICFISQCCTFVSFVALQIWTLQSIRLFTSIKFSVCVSQSAATNWIYLLHQKEKGVYKIVNKFSEKRDLLNIPINAPYLLFKDKGAGFDVIGDTECRLGKKMKIVLITGIDCSYFELSHGQASFRHWQV